MARLDNTRPVLRIDGEVSGPLGNDALWLSVEHDTEGLARLHACFMAQSGRELASQEPLLYLDGSVVDFGKTVAVTLGAGPRERTVFEGTITAIEAELVAGEPAQVHLFAEDGLMDLRMTRRCKTYRDATDEDIARQIAEANELSFEGGVDGPQYELVQQWNQSDLAFLRDRARKVRAELWVDGRTLHFCSRDRRAAPELDPIAFGHELLELSVRADLAHQRSAIAIGGLDLRARETIDGAAGEEAIAAEITAGKTGFATLERALGAGHDSIRVRDVPHDAAEADAWAKAEALRRGRRFVTAHGVTSGHPDMQVGCQLDLRRVGPAFTGDGYYVTSVRHTWQAERGHRTAFEAERAVLSEVR